MAERQRMTARIVGRVQGVGFRWWARSRAEELGLVGWVMNEDDERAVAVLAEGPRDALDAFESMLRHGPSGARIDAIEIAREPASGDHDRFEITRP